MCFFVNWCLRFLDMSHSLVQQTKEKHRQSFGIVKERIVTVQPCSVIEEVQQGGECGGRLSFCGPKNPKVPALNNLMWWNGWHRLLLHNQQWLNNFPFCCAYFSQCVLVFSPQLVVSYFSRTEIHFCMQLWALRVDRESRAICFLVKQKWNLCQLLEEN